MSLASQLNSNKILEVSNLESANEINTKSTYELGNVSFSHLIDASGNFHLQNNAGSVKLLSFDSSNNLLDCATKTHVANQVAPVNRTLTNHTLTLTDHETRLSNVESGSSGLQSISSVLAVGSNANNQSITNVNNLSCNGTVSGSNITTMQNVVNSYQTAIQQLQSRCTALESYNTQLKKLILSISESLVLKDPVNTSNNFDYTSLLN